MATNVPSPPDMASSKYDKKLAPKKEKPKMPAPKMPPAKKAMFEEEETFMAKKGGKVKKYAAGGLAAGHKAADGIAKKGKTKAKQIKMSSGGRAC